MKRSTIFLLFLGAVFGVHGQSLSPEVLSSGGESYNSPNVQLDWTAGESVIQTAAAGNTQLTQGFHQTQLTITAIDPDLQNPFEVKVFPNPAQEYVFVEAEAGHGPAMVRLVDMHGRILSQPSPLVAGERQEFDLSQVALGQYLIQIVSLEGGPLRTFKVIKSN